MIKTPVSSESKSAKSAAERPNGEKTRHYNALGGVFLSFAVLSVVFFANPGVSKAALIAEQRVADTQLSESQALSNRGASFFQMLAPALDATITRVVVKLSAEQCSMCQNITPKVIAYICESATSSPGSACVGGTSYQSDEASTTIATSTNGATSQSYQFTWSAGKRVDPAKYYWLQFYHSNSGGDCNIYPDCNLLFVWGADWDAYSGGAGFNTDNILDIYMYVEGIGGPPAVGAGSTVELLYPLATSTFSNNTMTWEALVKPTTPASLVYRLTLASTTALYDAGTNFDFFATRAYDTDCLPDGCIDSLNSSKVPVGWYYASARLETFGVDNLATSSSVLIYVGGNSAVTRAPVGSTEATTTQSIVCDSFSFGFGALCRLFVPSREERDGLIGYLNEEKDWISAKAPWGYFTLYQSAVSSSFDTATSTLVELPDFSPLTWWQTMLGYLNLGLYLLTGFWVFWRIKIFVATT